MTEKVTLRIEHRHFQEWRELVGHDCKTDEEMRTYVKTLDPDGLMLRTVELEKVNG